MGILYLKRMIEMIKARLSWSRARSAVQRMAIFMRQASDSRAKLPRLYSFWVSRLLA